MLVPCRECQFEGKCELQAEKSRLALFAWARGGLVDCADRAQRWWRGLEGVRA